MASNPIDYRAIQNTLSRYCIALDTKNFDLLHQVFTSDVEAKYPMFPNAITDVSELAEKIKKRLSPITSHHDLSTQIIEISEDGKSAKAETYFSGLHFGQGKWKGQELEAFGRYVDDLVLVEGKSIPGASGQWLIKKRDVVIMGRIGEEGIMDPA